MHNFVKPPPLPSLLRRAAQAARYTIRGIRPDTWMSPLNPQAPYAPTVAPRQYDFAVGRNLFYKPRGQERYTFEQLRCASRGSELIRLAIETRCDQVDALHWQIKPLADNEEVDDNDPRIKTITQFFESPDKVRDWSQWVRVILEELFVTDAVSIARRKNRGGGLYSLEPLDGATIFPIIDQDGRTPLPPDPAYQQILKGVPKADYTTAELIYYVRKSQVNTPYGMSVVEQIIQSADTDIERIKYTLAFFTEGSVPDAYITAPDGMTPEQVRAYEDHLNALLAGNAAGRRQMPVLVPGMEIKSMKQAELKNDFDEWLARKICMAFSLPPTAFVKQMNRNTSESAQDAAKEEGLFPVLNYVKRLIDRIIREDFGYTDLEFHWDDDQERDPKVQADIHGIYVDKGLMSRNEVRDELGLDDVQGGEEPMVTVSCGPVPLPGSKLDAQMKEEAQAQTDASQAHAIELTQVKSRSNDNESQAAGAGAEDATKMSKKKRAWYGGSPSPSTPPRP